MQPVSFAPDLWGSVMRVFRPPVFENDDDKTRLARGLHAVLLANTGLELFYCLFMIVTSPYKQQYLIAGLVSLIGHGHLSWLLYRGQVKLSARLFVAYFWVIISAIEFMTGNVTNIVTSLYIPIIVLTLLFLGRRASLINLALTMAYMIILTQIDHATMFPLDGLLPGISAWMVLAFGFVLVLIPLFSIYNDLSNALADVQEQLQERQKAQQSLRESEERFRLISSVASDYTFSSHFSAKGLEHVVLSGAFERITGYTPDAFVKKGGWAAIIHPDDAVQDAQDMATLRDQKSVVTDVRIIRKDGRPCWVRVYGYPLLEQGQLIGIYGAVQDINEGKLAEMALQESEKRYRVISDIISDYAYAYDVQADGSLSHYWITADSFKRLTGFETLERETGYSLYHPDDVALCRNDVAKTIAGEATSGEYRIITKSGELKWIYIKRQVEWDEGHQRVVRFYGAAQDITQQKLAQEALAKDRTLLRTVIDHLPDNIFVKDIEGRFVLNNKESMRRLGVAHQEDVLGKTDFDFFPHDLAEAWEKERQAIIQSGEPLLDFEEFQGWHESPHWILTSVILLHDEQGAIIGLVGINRDITERKQSEEALREKEAFLRALLDATPDIAFLMSPSGTLLTVNKPLAESLGINIEDALGKNGFDFLKADLKGDRFRQFQQCLDTRQPVRWEDGRSNTWWDNSFYPVLSASGEVEAVAVYSKNITEEKRLAAELQRYATQLEQMVEERTAELRRAKEQIEIILNNTRDAIALAQVNGTIETRNPAFIQLFGEQVSQWLERILWTVTTEEQTVSVSNALMNTIQNREGQRIELQIVSETGGQKDIDLAFIPVQLTGKQDGSGVLVSAHDITHIKQIERFKTRFIDDAVHDLATPIAGLTNRLYLLKKSPEKLDEHLSKLENQVGHLRDLLDDLRSLSQMDRGQLELKVEYADINRIVERVFDTYEPVALSKGQQLTLEMADALPEILVDNRQMERVFVNLVSNAVNYTLNDKMISVRTQLDADWIVFSVTDGGIGIASEELPHVFERFYRTVRARATQSSGTGLGLAIVKEIVEQHGGTVSAESEVGQGSTFTVRLPITRALL